MSILPQIGDFPGTIANLPNPPRMDPFSMQAALQADVSALWTAVKALVTELNEKAETTIDYTSTDDELATAKAIYDFVMDIVTGGGMPTPAQIGAAQLDSALAALTPKVSKVDPDQASAYIVDETADFTLALARHSGKFVRATSVSGIICTIPANSSVAFPVGIEIEVMQNGAGTVTIAAATGVTICAQDNCVETSGQYATCCLKKLDTNTWHLAGHLV